MGGLSLTERIGAKYSGTVTAVNSYVNSISTDNIVDLPKGRYRAVLRLLDLGLPGGSNHTLEYIGAQELIVEACVEAGIDVDIEQIPEVIQTMITDITSIYDSNYSSDQLARAQKFYSKLEEISQQAWNRRRSIDIDDE